MLILYHIVLLYAFAVNCRVLYDRSGIRLCNPKTPCPAGSACMYSRVTPGVKACFQGVTSVEKHPGRCPHLIGPMPVSYNWKQCYFDADCPSAQKCCSTGNAEHICVQSQPNSPLPTVTVLINGAINISNQGSVFDFVGSVGLVQSGGFNVLFDTGGIVEGIELLDKLKYLGGLYPEDIDYVVTSHGHPDHLANIALFPDVPNNFDTFTITGDRYTTNALGSQPPSRLYINGDPNMEIIETPGHTLQDTSLVVRNVPGKGTVVLAGDIFLTADDYTRPAQGQDVQKLTQSRSTIACLADYILPGHGPLFQVTSAIKQSFNCPNTGK